MSSTLNCSTLNVVAVADLPQIGLALEIAKRQRAEASQVSQAGEIMRSGAATTWSRD